MSLLCLERLKDLPFHSVKTSILTVAGLAFEIGSPISFLTFPPSFSCYCSATGPVSHPSPAPALPSGLSPHHVGSPSPLTCHSVLWGLG